MSNKALLENEIDIQMQNKSNRVLSPMVFLKFIQI